MKVVTILGARPQFIKASALSRVIKNDRFIKEIIVHTGQHYDADMSDVFFYQLHIPKPHYNLAIKSPFHGQMTGRMIEKIEEVLISEKPDMVIVYGDTNSTLAGSIAAKKLHIKVAHIEAGLRSHNMKMAEEINRVLTDRISDILFCPSALAIKNLITEGFANHACGIYDVGDIMKDVAFYYRNLTVKPVFNVPEKFILATLHRAENTDDEGRLREILHALNVLSEQIPVILPVHPRTKSAIDKITFKHNPNFILQAPVGYLEMLYLIKSCQLVVTDSGGLQKEAFYFDKYCITIRDETEWTELVTGGYNTVTGANSDIIVENAKRFLQAPSFSNQLLYGDGNTAEKILDVLKTVLS